MKIYLAGPMRGIPEFNFPAFYAGAAALEADGHTVFNPAAKDNEKHGTDIGAGNMTGDEEYASKQHGFSLREALGADLRFICEEADAIALLPGWEQSSGATAEHATAKALGLKVIKLPGKPPLRTIPLEYVARVDEALGFVRAELLKARAKFGPFRSNHEGWGVIEEEWIEMRREIMANNTELACKEAMQTAAMCVSFIADLGLKPQ